jgi:glucokinase
MVISLYSLFLVRTNKLNVLFKKVGAWVSKSKFNLEMMKKMNRSLILDTIRNQQPISRAKIAQNLQLSRSTVSSIVEDLLHKKLVVELGYGSSTKEGGRRGLELGFNPKSAYGIGIDIGGTKILVVITDLDGCMVFREKYPTTDKIDKLIEIINQCLDKAEMNESDIIAMGVGVPSITTKEGIVVDAPALNWSNVNLKGILQEKFAFPVFVNNDVNCAALGERWLGSAKNSDDIFFIAIGTGVGSAIIANGELIHGYDYRAGEIAYNVSEKDIEQGLENKMGEFGVFENKISGTFLSKQGYTSDELFIENMKGDRKAADIIDNFILQLSINISNVVNLLNPEIVVIGGGVSESMGGIAHRIQETIDRLTPIKTKIGLATLGGDAGGLGAIAYAFKEVEESNRLGD